MAGETILSIAYGIDVTSKDDSYLKFAQEATRSVVAAAIPGTFLVDSIPLLKYVPEWMPFAGFKRKARHWRKFAEDAVNKPYEFAKRTFENGHSLPSYVARCLQNISKSKNVAFQEEVIKTSSGSMFVAGSDSTIGVIASCILGFLTNPVALKKAQEEIDRVIGANRLPTFEDVESLPYITAIAKEALRWRDVAPIGLPHFLDADDEYNGYRIPKGSIIIANCWAMLHDESVYPQPFEFNPDRFMKDGKLDPDAKDPMHAAFGFGRRICPGRFMAFSAIWITMASLIAVFDIEKERDSDGKVIEPSHEYISSLAYMPKPFKCSITPRSKQAQALIEASAQDEY
ncbi:hypothetical protein H0H93_012135 [Arthromyces matolae]|nr:hypothetical protein H0H93_012135 [Arthromyces matolae]